MALGLRGSWLAKLITYLPLVGHLYLSCSSHASVAVPLNLFDLAGSHIHLEGAIAPDLTFPVLPRNRVVTCSQRNPKPTLIISREERNRVISLLYDESSIRKRSRIGNAQSRWLTMNEIYRNHSSSPVSGSGVDCVSAKTTRQENTASNRHMLRTDLAENSA